MSECPLAPSKSFPQSIPWESIFHTVYLQLEEHDRSTLRGAAHLLLPLPRTFRCRHVKLSLAHPAPFPLFMRFFMKECSERVYVGVASVLAWMVTPNFFFFFSSVSAPTLWGVSRVSRTRARAWYVDSVVYFWGFPRRQPQPMVVPLLVPHRIPYPRSGDQWFGL